MNTMARTLVAYVSADHGKRLMGDKPLVFHCNYYMGFELLGDAIMPFDLVADQMPKLVGRDDRTYRLGFKPVLEDDQLTSGRRDRPRRDRRARAAARRSDQRRDSG